MTCRIACQSWSAAAQSTDRIERLWADRLVNWGDTPNENGIGVAPRDMPINFLDNHDVPRFLYNVRDLPAETQQALLHNAILFQFTAQGVPCVYYGTEQALRGGNDPANRERLWDTGFDVTHPTFQWMQRVARIRAQYASLRKGGVQVVYATEHFEMEPDAGMLAYERLGGDGGGSYALVVFNTSQTKTSATADPDMDRVMTVTAPEGTVLVDVLQDGDDEYVVGAGGELVIELEPMSGVLLVPAAEFEEL